MRKLFIYTICWAILLDVCVFSSAYSADPNTTVSADTSSIIAEIRRNNTGYLELQQAEGINTLAGLVLLAIGVKYGVSYSIRNVFRNSGVYLSTKEYERSHNSLNIGEKEIPRGRPGLTSDEIDIVKKNFGKTIRGSGWLRRMVQGQGNDPVYTRGTSLRVYLNNNSLQSIKGVADNFEIKNYPYAANAIRDLSLNEWQKYVRREALLFELVYDVRARAFFMGMYDASKQRGQQIIDLSEKILKDPSQKITLDALKQAYQAGYDAVTDPQRFFLTIARGTQSVRINYAELNPSILIPADEEIGRGTLSEKLREISEGRVLGERSIPILGRIWGGKIQAAEGIGRNAGRLALGAAIALDLAWAADNLWIVYYNFNEVAGENAFRDFCSVDCRNYPSLVNRRIAQFSAAGIIDEIFRNSPEK